MNSTVLISRPGERQFSQPVEVSSDAFTEVDSGGEFWAVIEQGALQDTRAAKANPGQPTEAPAARLPYRAIVFNSAGKKVVERKGDVSFLLREGSLYMLGHRGKVTRVNLTSDTETVVDEHINFFPEHHKPGFLTWEFTPAHMGIATRADPLMVRIANAKDPLLVAAGISNFYADPLDRFILYADGDALLIREIGPVPIALYKEMQASARRTKLLSDAKIVGIAMMLFAADLDGNLPPGDGWKDKLYPYVKSNEMLKDFVFMLPGVQLSSIKDPANTVLGIIVGPDGQAVLYADGHAKWKPNG